MHIERSTLEALDSVIVAAVGATTVALAEANPGRVSVTTGDEVVGRALRLAQEDSETEPAVLELLRCCGGRRVSVVIARQRLEGDLKEHPDDQVKMRAVQLLDRVLELGSWDLE